VARQGGRFSNPGPDRPKGQDLRTLKQVGSFLKPYWPRAVMAGIALTVTAGTVLGLGQGLRALIDSGFADGDEAALDRALTVLVGLSVVMAVGTYFRFTLVSWLGERVVADLRNAVFKRVLSLDPGFFEVTKTGEILSRLTTDTTLLQSIVGSTASMALRNILILVGGIVMLFITNPKLTLLALGVVPLVVVPILVIGRKVRRVSRDSQDRVADVGAFAEESFNAIRTLQAFTHEREDERRFEGEVRDAFDTGVLRIQLRGILTAIVILLVFLAIAVILWVGGHDVMSGRITGGELAAFVFYATIVAFAVGVLSEILGELQRAAGATERLFELLEATPAIIAPDHPTPLPEPGDGAVRFQAVGFTYPSRPDMPALRAVDLDVAPGETVALVGPSGAGKSTMFQLLMRFYDPDQGCLTLDGVDLRETDPKDLRRRLAIVAQDPTIFSASGMENIRYGNPDAPDEAVYQAARDAAADGFLRELPDGYDSFLGEKGTRLSGGQKQRIAIARALLRDPDVLLLDEATSALDAESERLVQQALGRLMQGRTTLIIAHRLSTVVNADRIAVMDRGQVVATGTHAELLESNPLYANLAKLQFSEPVARDAEAAE
jgi:ATP-binding cassette subfamily B protein